MLGCSTNQDSLLLATLRWVMKVVEICRGVALLRKFNCKSKAALIPVCELAHFGAKLLCTRAEVEL